MELVVIPGREKSTAFADHSRVDEDSIVPNDRFEIFTYE